MGCGRPARGRPAGPFYQGVAGGQIGFFADAFNQCVLLRLAEAAQIEVAVAACTHCAHQGLQAVKSYNAMSDSLAWLPVSLALSVFAQPQHHHCAYHQQRPGDLHGCNRLS